jgi:hypothetical protein
VAAGIPVIASEACGLEGVPGVITIPAGDEAALREAIRSLDCVDTTEWEEMPEYAEFAMSA